LVAVPKNIISIYFTFVFILPELNYSDNNGLR